MTLETKDIIPIQTHKGSCTLQVLLFTFCLLPFILCILKLFFLGPVIFVFYLPIMLPFNVLAVLVILYKRIPIIKVFKGQFVIEKKGIIKKYNEQHCFIFDEIKRIEFSKGKIDWPFLIVLALFGRGAGGQSGNNKSDRMIIETKEGQLKIFNRFGSKKGFIQTIELINKLIQQKKAKG